LSEVDPYQKHKRSKTTQTRLTCVGFRVCRDVRCLAHVGDNEAGVNQTTKRQLQGRSNSSSIRCTVSK
jgi:hypothetical protein